MRLRTCLFLVLTLLFTAQVNSSYSLTTAPQIALDNEAGYDRSFFKHWIDADKNGCDTRAEVLIAEALVKPKIGKKCKLKGGKWLSAYDGKTVKKSSKLDVDHLIPLAEAWRSGAWAWTSQQRQDFANDFDDKRSLIAVTLSTNRSKSDRDISEWVPVKKTCAYVKNWIAIKIRYSLTYDTNEAAALVGYFESCKIGNISVVVLPGYSYQSETTEVIEPVPTATSEPSVSPTAGVTITPGSFCSTAGAIGTSSSGVSYTCKSSLTDTRNRWRQ